MPKSIKEERIRWVKPIVEGDVRLKDVIGICPYSARTLKRWKKAFELHGEQGLDPLSTAPKCQPNETQIHIKEEVITLRKKTKLCAQKLHWRLAKRGVHVPVRTIGKILKQEGLVRRYRKKKVKYKYLRVLRKPGELIEIDVKHVPGCIQGRKYFQYTAIDTATRWRHLEIFDAEISFHSVRFLGIVMQRFPHRIQSIKTDNHSTFTNYYTGTNKRSDMTVKNVHALDAFCAKHGMIHYLIDPGTPSQNGTVERSHREDEEKFYQRNKFSSVSDLKCKLRKWNNYYNNLEHCSLAGQTPLEVLQSNLSIKKVPKALA